MTTEPIKGPASYFPSIEKKYGRPIGEWQQIVRDRLPEKHMNLVSMLKVEHGMGHGHANAIVAHVLSVENAYQPYGQCGMTWDDVLAIGLTLPRMEAATSYGTPALKVRGKLVTRLRTEDDSLVLLGIPPDERPILIEADPAVFHTSAHYDGYPAVLARLAALNEHQLWPFLLRRWREVAPKRVTAEFDQPPGPSC